MEAIQFNIPCPKCGNLGFKQPDNPSPQDLPNGLVSCAACGHVLTVDDVNRFKAAIADSQANQDPISASVGQAVRDVFK